MNSILKYRAHNQERFLSHSVVTKPHHIIEKKTEECVNAREINEINKLPEFCTKKNYSVDKARISKSLKLSCNTKTTASTLLSRDHDNKFLPMLSPKLP